MQTVKKPTVQPDKLPFVGTNKHVHAHNDAYNNTAVVLCDIKGKPKTAVGLYNQVNVYH